MRLLHIETQKDGTISLTFNEYYEELVPPYVILSHTWGADEVSYEDFISGRAARLQGYKKIYGCATNAKARGHDFIWVDTCCIDKRSSAELTEAINSMFNWYKKAAECYALLSDAPTKMWQESRWFTRGWTLQELIAPRDVLFYDSHWNLLGTKAEWALRLPEVAKINAETLEGWTPQNALVGERLYWASNRSTTRTEDQAYCLLGLFDINMPLLYGEGLRAFRRLQEEVVRNTADYSVFMWSVPAVTQIPGRAIPPGRRDSQKQIPLFSGAFAESPAAFHKWQTNRWNDDVGHAPAAVVSEGVQMHISLRPKEGEPHVYDAYLNICAGTPAFAIHLLEIDPQKTDGKAGQHHRRFVRVRPDLLKPWASWRLDLHVNNTTEIVVLDLVREPLFAAQPQLDMEVSVEGPIPFEIFGDNIARTRVGGQSHLLAAAKVGKMFAFIVSGRGGHFVLIGFGLSDFCAPWCRIIHRLSKPEAELSTHASMKLRKLWESYVNPSGEDLRSSDEIEGLSVHVRLIWRRRRLKLVIEISNSSDHAVSSSIVHAF